MECKMPTINTSDDAQLKDVFITCKNIAIIGLSPDESKASNIVAKYLQSQGFKIIPIYPKEDVILGEKVYRSLLDVEQRVDMVDMFRKPDFADSLVQEAIQRGDVKCLWLQLGIVNDDAIQKAIDAGMTGVQNKCTKIEHQRLF